MCDFCWCCDETSRTPGSLDDVTRHVCVKLQAVITNSLTNSLSNFMEQGPSREADGSSASQEILCILWNRQVHYRIQNSPPPVHASPYHFLKSHFNIILSTTPQLSKWPLYLRSSHQIPACPSSIPHTCHVPRPSHSNIW